MTSKPKTIDGYLAALSDDQRAALVRKLVKARIAENAAKRTK
jgi:hypothetical protein